MTLNLDRDLTGLRGAAYNPRLIDDATLDRLGESLRRLGCVKPMIARGSLLVAGHQRTKALLRNGVTRGPVYELPKSTTTYDEVRFNQLHNGTDLDAGDEACRIAGPLDLGYQVVDASRLSGNTAAKGAVIRREIADLILAYGPWGGVVATQSGEVIHCGQYALAAMLTRTPCTTFVIHDSRRDEYAGFLGARYGAFSYEHLAKDTFIQTLAQMYRLRPSERGLGLKSALYEGHVLPWLKANPRARVFDFGSG